MRKIIISTICLAFFTTSFAQNKIHEAFNKSFGYEQYEYYDKAINALMEVYSEKNYVINLRLGYLHFMNEDYSKSVSYYKKAIGLKPSSIEARLGYVNPAAEMGNMDAVKKTYMEILELDPEYTLVSYRLAYMFYEDKNYAEAEKYLNKVLALYPFDYYSNALMGYVLKGKGDNGNAIAYWEVALMYNPNDQEIKDQLITLK